jgi:hypothetical protein
MAFTSSGSSVSCPCGCGSAVQGQDALIYLSLELASRALVECPNLSNEADLVLGRVERERRTLLGRLHDSERQLGAGQIVGSDLGSLWLRIAGLLRECSSAAAYYSDTFPVRSSRSLLSVRIQEGFETAFSVINHFSGSGSLDSAALGRAVDDINIGLDRVRLPARLNTWLEDAAGNLERVALGDIREHSIRSLLISARASWAGAAMFQSLCAMYGVIGLVVASRDILRDLESGPYWDLSAGVEPGLDPEREVDGLAFLLSEIDVARLSIDGTDWLSDDHIDFESPLGVTRAASQLALERGLGEGFLTLLEMQAVPLEVATALASMDVTGTDLEILGFRAILEAVRHQHAAWAGFRFDVMEWLSTEFRRPGAGPQTMPAEIGSYLVDLFGSIELEPPTKGKGDDPGAGAPGSMPKPTDDPVFQLCISAHQRFASAATSVDLFLRGARSRPSEPLVDLSSTLPTSTRQELRQEFERLVAVVTTLREPRPLYEGVDLLPDWNMARSSIVKLAGLRLLADTVLCAHHLLEDIIDELAPHASAEFAVLCRADVVGPTPELCQDTLDVLCSLYTYAARIDHRATRNAHGEVGHVAGIWLESQALLELLQVDARFIPDSVATSVQAFLRALTAQQKPRLRPASIRAHNMALAHAARDLMRAVNEAAK